MKNNSYVIAVRVSVFYFAVSIAWIIFSDRALSIFIVNRNLFETVNTFKGILYVIITTTLLFGSLIHYLNESHNANQILTESMKKQEEIKNQLNKIAYFDQVTELPNINSLKLDYQTMVKDMQKSFILMKLSMNQFGMIKELYGVSGGESFLRNLSARLKEVLNEEETLYKLERADFVIIIKNDPSVLSILQRTRIIMDCCCIPWEYKERIFYPSASTGIVKYPLQGFELEELFKNAEIALSEARRKEKDNYCIYSDKLKHGMEAFINMYQDLHKAIYQNEFMLVYQPIILLCEERVTGVEALIRWKHPVKGMIPPGEFIPIAENTGLIHEIGSWVMKTAFWQKIEWENAGIRDLKLSINISGASLMQNSFLEEVEKILEKYPVDTEAVQFEITESTYILNITRISKVLQKIRDRGILIALDDFGTGYSSFNYLKTMPIDVIKLDATFMSGILNSTQDRIIFDAINQLTHDLGMSLIAEGIETEDENILIRQEGCDFGQGYLYGKPSDPEQILKLLESQKTMLQ